MAEHDDAVAAAAEHISAKPEPSHPLAPLPGGFAITRAALHVAAEHLLKPKRVLETGNEIALQFTPGGFGTPAWEDGVTSGGPGQARVEGVELVSVEMPYESRAPVTDIDGGAGLLGIESPPEDVDRDLEADPDPRPRWPTGSRSGPWRWPS